MQGFNTQEISAIMYAVFMFMPLVFIMLGLWMMYSGLKKLAYSSQLSGGMGGRALSGEGWTRIFAGLGFLNMRFIVNSFGGDVFNRSESYSWTPITASTDDPLLFVGQVIINGLLILGLIGISSVYLDLPKLANGQVSGGTLLTRFFISILVIEIQWVNDAIATITPFNPLGLFLPGSGVINL